MPDKTKSLVQAMREAFFKAADLPKDTEISLDLLYALGVSEEPWRAVGCGAPQT